ncbi:MAG: FtsX-like permease family protein, partial [Patescibacteria group bacterium]|nr:FtsX-like permease family protein [Patescibacteria group bacterium]
TDGRDELRAQGSGVIEQEENSVFPFSRSIVNGRCFQSGEEVMVLGKGLADLFKVNTGDQITVIARTRYEALTALDLTIVGIVYTDNPEIDNFYFYIPFDVAQRFLEMENSITEVALKLRNRNKAPEFYNTLLRNEPQIASLDIITWEEMTKDMLRFFEFRKKARHLMSAVLILMAAAGIANTMLMATYERIREIGMMMAIGMKPMKIIAMFSLESAYIGLFGSILGCLLGGSLTYYFTVYGLDVSTFGITQTGAMYVPHRVYAALTADMIIIVFLIGIFIAFVAGLYPAVHASKLKPVQAMRTI